MTEQVLTTFAKTDEHIETIDDTKLNKMMFIEDTDVTAISWYDHQSKLELDSSEEMEQSSQAVLEQHLIPLPTFYQGSLDQALMSSLFACVNPKPLALYLYHDQSMFAKAFEESTICPEAIISYLAKQFVVWAWDRTTDINYSRLLTLLLIHTGDEVAAKLDSISINAYPLLVCLSFTRGQINIETIIDGSTSSTEALSLLVQASDAFDQRLELPDTTGLSMTTVSTEDWRMSGSTLTQVAEQSAEFQRVSADFAVESSTITRIDRIDNPVWLVQYLNQKQIIDTRLGYTDTERLLFHGCPYSAAEQILQKGFEHRLIGRHGSSYGCGFYFSSNPMYSDRYAQRNQSSNGERRILMCRVLIGQSCPGNAAMTTCPSNYDSTSGESNIYVVYSNRQVLPEYLITYK